MIEGKGARIAAMVIAVVAMSCGLETVESVPKPIVMNYRSQNPQDLVFEHDPEAYSGVYFQGYDLYYKVYPFDAAFGNLSADSNAIQSTNTIEGLKLRGYQRMNGDLSSLSATPLIGVNSSNVKQTLTVDFTTDAPQVRFSSGDAPVSLYRTLVEKSSGIPSFLEFSLLHQFISPLPNDYQSTITLQDNYLEIDVFLVAVALSTDLVPVSSPPVALGTIEQISVAP